MPGIEAVARVRAAPRGMPRGRGLLLGGVGAVQTAAGFLRGLLDEPFRDRGFLRGGFRGGGRRILRDDLGDSLGVDGGGVARGQLEDDLVVLVVDGDDRAEQTELGHDLRRPAPVPTSAAPAPSGPSCGRGTS